MPVIRRLYLYAIAFVALGMFLMGSVQLLQMLLETLVETMGGGPTALGESLIRQRLSFSIALALIGLAGWTIHWWLACRALSGPAGAAERRSVIRRLYLYAVLLTGGMIGLGAASGLAHDLLRFVFGESTRAAIIAGALVDPSALLLITAVLWTYHARIAEADRAAQPEVGGSATLRRWFIYCLSFVSLMVLVPALVSLLQVLWSMATGHLPGAPTPVADTGLFTAQIASSAAGALAALVVWLAAWQWSRGWLTTSGLDSETMSVLRKVYHYLVLAVAVSFTTWSAGNVLYQLLRVVLVPERAALGWTEASRGLGPAIATVLVFWVVWVYHARSLRQETVLATEAPRQALIRRFYGYLVALIGVAAVGIGIAGTIATVLDLAIQPLASRPTAWWQDHIAVFATLAAVGLPIWLAFWLPIQQEARALPAQRSVVRRIYLFLVFGATVLTMLVSGVFALYQLVRLALGEGWTAGQTTDTLSAVSALLVAGLLLVYHLRLLSAGGGAADAQPEVYRLRIVARSANAAQLEAYGRDVLAHVPSGVELQIDRVLSDRDDGKPVSEQAPELRMEDARPTRVA